MPRVIHFELPVDDPDRAISFYETVFGWEIKKWEGPMEYWLVMTGPEDRPGIDGGLMKRTHPEATTVNTIDVPSVDEFLEKIQANGGEVVMPKDAIPGVGWFAYCKDTEGNMFGIMESDESAK
ncbi:MAG: VOC family protein [Candidatus Aquicultorales bacterium]